MSGLRGMVTRTVARLGFYLLVAAILIYTVLPFYWAIVSSLKGGIALFEPSLVPWQPTLDNYAAVFRGQPFARAIANALLVATLATCTRSEARTSETQTLRRTVPYAFSVE